MSSGEPQRKAWAPLLRSRARNRRWLRRSGLLSCFGLAVVLVTFRWPHPLAFVAMLLVGGGCIALGVGGALFALLDHPAATDGEAAER